MISSISTRPAGTLLLLLGVAFAGSACCAAAAQAQAVPMRHHITLGGGYAQYVDKDLTGGGEVFDNAGFGTLAYRYSFTPRLDLSFDARAVAANESGLIDVGGTIFDVSLDVNSSWFGPGVRYHFTDGRVRPYVQGSILFVDEEVSAEISGISGSDSWSGIGVGAFGGVDLRLGKLVSIPIEAHYMYGKPEDDVSNWGFGLGVTFNFGPLPSLP